MRKSETGEIPPNGGEISSMKPFNLWFYCQCLVQTWLRIIQTTLMMDQGFAKIFRIKMSDGDEFFLLFHVYQVPTHGHTGLFICALTTLFSLYSFPVFIFSGNMRGRYGAFASSIGSSEKKVAKIVIFCKSSPPPDALYPLNPSQTFFWCCHCL